MIYPFVREYARARLRNGATRRVGRERAAAYNYKWNVQPRGIDTYITGERIERGTIEMFRTSSRHPRRLK